MSTQQIQRTLHNVGRRLQEQSLADSSRRQYGKVWDQWLIWCRHFRYQPFLQDDYEPLYLFALYAWHFGFNKQQKGNTYGTVRRKLNAIAWHHRANGYPIPQLSDAQRLALLGMQKLSPAKRIRKPVTPALLRAIYARLDFSTPSNQLLWGGILLGFFFLLRRSNICGKNGKQHLYQIRGDDIVFESHEGKTWEKAAIPDRVKLRIRGEKNHTRDGPQFRTMCQSGDDALCPVKGAMWAKSGARKLGLQERQPLLGFRYPKGVEAKELSMAIKTGAEALGLDKDHYTIHSLRAGGATALFGMGYDGLAVKTLGRWLSDAYMVYTTVSPVVTQTMSAAMARFQDEITEGPPQV